MSIAVTLGRLGDRRFFIPDRFHHCPTTHDGIPAVAQRPKTRPKSGVTKAGATGLEPATSAVTGQRSNQLSYAPAFFATRARHILRLCARSQYATSFQRPSSPPHHQIVVDGSAPIAKLARQPVFK